MRGLDLWSLKSKTYRAGRSLPLVRRILDTEVRNLKALLCDIEVPLDGILDIGSGSGSTLDILPKGKFRIFMDRSTGMTRTLRQMHAYVVRADAQSMPFREGSFSFVAAVGLTEYIREKDRLVDEVERVILPGGFFLSTISPPGLLNSLRNLMGHRIHSIRRGVWKRLLSSRGFRIQSECKSMVQAQFLYKS